MRAASEAKRIAAALTYRCDKCHAEWVGNASGQCPTCGVGIDIGNALARACSDQKAVANA